MMTNQYWCLPSSCTLLALTRAQRLYIIILGRLLKAGLTSVSLALLPPSGLPCTILGHSRPLWCLRQVQVLVVLLA